MKEGLFDYLNRLTRADLERTKKYSDIEWSEALNEEAKRMLGFADTLIKKTEIESKAKVDILPRINPWDSLDYNNITTPYRSGYSMIFQDFATIGVPHLGWYFLAAGQMPVPVYLS